MSGCPSNSAFVLLFVQLVAACAAFAGCVVFLFLLFLLFCFFCCLCCWFCSFVFSCFACCFCFLVVVCATACVPIAAFTAAFAACCRYCCLCSCFLVRIGRPGLPLPTHWNVQRRPLLPAQCSRNFDNPASIGPTLRATNSSTSRALLCVRIVFVLHCASNLCDPFGPHFF